MGTPQLILALTIATASPCSLTAQRATHVSPIALAAGPTWYPRLTGLHLRAEYHLMRDRWFGLRLEGGGRWTPTQSFSEPTLEFGDGSHYQGTWQYADLDLGVAAILAPNPHGRVSPYLLVGATAMQRWGHGQTFYTNPQGGLAKVNPPSSGTHGEVGPFVGFGLRVRFGDRPFAVELRRGGSLLHDLTLGTVLGL